MYVIVTSTHDITGMSLLTCVFCCNASIISNVFLLSLNEQQQNNVTSRMYL